VGDKEGAAWASTAGATWTHSVGRATLRLRGAWGRGLRPPEPGMSRAMATATVRQLPNSELASETQSGIEVGTEVYAGAAAYARATWYDQRATDLIQQVLLPSDGTIRNYQFQNVGGITNRGVELEAGAGWNRVTLSGFLYFTRSEVRRLARNYTGELKPGDELPEVPEHVGAVALQYAAGRVRATVGASWLGSWTGFDWVALRATELGQEPRRATLRDYWIDYPAVFRPYFAAEIGLGGAWAAFLRVDNPGKTASYLRDNLTPPLGRSTQLGLELRP
jgi:outer membrane receptor protein involved in Fe transport